jgi:hypothetical protein
MIHLVYLWLLLFVLLAFFRDAIMNERRDVQAFCAAVVALDIMLLLRFLHAL